MPPKSLGARKRKRRRSRGTKFARGGTPSENDCLSAGECGQRNERDGYPAQSESRPIDSWTCLRASGRIYFETGALPLKLESLPQGVRLAVQAAQNKKAGAVTVINLNGHAAFTEYFVICTGFSTPQLQAICNEVEELLYREMKRTPEHREGHRSAEWALLDFGGFIVHVFGEQARKYYDLERLWRAAPSLVLPDETDLTERPSRPTENYLQP